MKKAILIAAFIIFFIFLCIFIVLINGKKIDELTLYGNIEIRQVDLSFQVAGQILKMLKEEGDVVKKNELVALMDKRDYESNFIKAKAETKRTFALYSDAKSQYERKKPLCADNIVSELECDNLLYAKNKTEADYNAALANEQFNKNQFDYTKIYSPDDGIVTVRVQEPGATVSKGQAVYTIAKNKPVWIRAYVNERDLGNIKYGQTTEVYTDTIDPNTGVLRKYHGQVGYISPVAEFTPKTVQSTDLRTNLVYRIRVYVDNIDEYLRQGMPVTVKIKLSDGNANVRSKNTKFNKNLW